MYDLVVMEIGEATEHLQGIACNDLLRKLPVSVQQGGDRTPYSIKNTNF